MIGAHAVAAMLQDGVDPVTVSPDLKLAYIANTSFSPPYQPLGNVSPSPMSLHMNRKSHRPTG